MPDAIMKTVWDAKDSISAECHFSPRELAEMLKNSKLSQGEKTVDLHEHSNTPKARVVKHKKSLSPTPCPKTVR